MDQKEFDAKFSKLLDSLLKISNRQFNVINILCSNGTKLTDNLRPDNTTEQAEKFGVLFKRGGEFQKETLPILDSLREEIEKLMEEVQEGEPQDTTWM